MIRSNLANNVQHSIKVYFIKDFVNTQTLLSSCCKLIKSIKHETLLPDFMIFNGEQKNNDYEKAADFVEFFFSIASDLSDMFTDFSDGIYNLLEFTLTDC